MSFGRPDHRGIAIPVVLALVLAACSSGVSGGGAPDGELALDVSVPQDGAEVGQSFEVQVTSNVPLGAPDTGNHHVHLYFDTDISSPDYQIVYGEAAVVDRTLEPGEHTIIASLRNADHSDAGPMDEITVTVTDDGAAATNGADPSGGGFPDY